MGHVELRVEPATVDQLRALIAGGDGFEFDVVDGYLKFDGTLERALQALTERGADPQWHTYLFVHVEDRALIGLGGFKGPPRDGVVEIGYGIAPAYRGRGYATQAAWALLDRARAAGVDLVCAHTLGEPNASTRVLQHLGFARTAVGHDPDVGDIWRWEKPLSG